MIAYVNRGPRDYRRRPVSIQRRNQYEFQAVLTGRIAPLRMGGAAPMLRSAWLWVLPPDDPHGWTGDGEPATVAVFHLTEVPPLVTAASANGLGLAIDADIAHQLDGWAATILADRQQPTTHAQFRAAVIESHLVQIAAGGIPERPIGDGTGASLVGRRLSRAIAWMADHLHEGGGIEGAALAAGLSPAQFRRQVARHRGESPRSLLTGMRIARARELLMDAGRSLEDVAAASGFASASALCRAYRRATGSTPRG
jgi:AraC-like DNA-binding protein